jgi:hypothetical protein
LENNQQNPKTKTNSKKKLLLVVASVLVVALAIGLTASILMSVKNPSNSQTGNQNDAQSWVKVGAYATYEGQASIIGIDVSFNAKMQIVDLNQTHIEVATDFNMSTPYGATENRTTTWVNRESMTFQQNGMTLNNTYNSQVTLAKLGTRSCTVYEYSNEGISAAYYSDNTVHWPVKMVMTSPTSVDGQSYNMDINLVDSNIPGL